MTGGWAPLLAAGPGKRWVSADEHSLHVWSGSQLESSAEMAGLLGGPPRVLSDDTALVGRFEINLRSATRSEIMPLDSVLEVYDPMGDENQLVIRVAWTADGTHALVFAKYLPTRLRGGSDAVRPGAVLALAHRGDTTLQELDRGRHLAAEPLAGDQWLVSGGDRVRAVDPATGKLVIDAATDDPATAVATSGDVVVAGLSDGQVLGALVADGDVSRRWSDHEAVVVSVALSADSRLVASGDRSGRLIVRRWDDGEIVHRDELPGSVEGLCFLSADHLVVAVEMEDELRHVDLGSS